MQKGNNWPLKGWKDSLWEGGVHCIGFVVGIMLQSKGTINRELVHVSDWFPTLMNLAGGNTTSLTLDGHNVWEAIRCDLCQNKYFILPSTNITQTI